MKSFAGIVAVAVASDAGELSCCRSRGCPSGANLFRLHGYRNPPSGGVYPKLGWFAQVLSGCLVRSRGQGRQVHAPLPWRRAWPLHGRRELWCGCRVGRVFQPCGHQELEFGVELRWLGFAARAFGGWCLASASTLRLPEACTSAASISTAWR